MARFVQQGPISLDTVAEFFGNTSRSLQDYYRGGGIVPSTGPTNGRSSSHQIIVAPNSRSVATGGTDVSTVLRLTLNSDRYDITLGAGDSVAIANTIVETLRSTLGQYYVSRATYNSGNLLFFDFEDVLNLGYSTQTSTFTSGTGFAFAFVSGSPADYTTAAENNLMRLPTTRPTSARMIARRVFLGQMGTIGFQYAFPGVVTTDVTFNHNVIDGPTTLTDVSMFNRRLVCVTDNFSASYAIDEVAFNPGEYYILSDGRALNDEEQAFIDNTAAITGSVGGRVTHTIMGTDLNIPIVTIDDSQQRDGGTSIDSLNVTTRGTSDFPDNGVILQTVRQGAPVVSTLTNTNAAYTTDASLISNEWGFFTGPLSTDTNRGIINYPGNDTVFARLNDDLFSAADLQVAFGLDRVPDTTEQTVNNTTIVLGAVSYTITGIRTVSNTDSDVNFILDGSTRSASGGIAGGGDITLTGLFMGDINMDIPESGAISFDNFYNANDGSNN